MSDTAFTIAFLIIFFGAALIGAAFAIHDFEILMFGIILLLIAIININSNRIEKLENKK